MKQIMEFHILRISFFPFPHHMLNLRMFEFLGMRSIKCVRGYYFRFYSTARRSCNVIDGFAESDEFPAKPESLD